jgi:hypothetical protein
VAQSSLRRFAQDGEHLFVFDKVSGEVRPANVRDVAEERYSNRIPLEELTPEFASQIIDPDGIEKALSAIESDYNATVGRIIQATGPRGLVRRISDALRITSAKCISKRQKQAMSFFVALQYVRTREFRDTIAEGSKKFAEAVMKFVPPEQRDEFSQMSTITPTKNRRTLAHLDFMIDPDVLRDFSGILSNHIWVVGLNHTSHALYTSDHPVVRLPHTKHPFLGNAGLGSPGIEIAVPLSSTHILFLWEKEYFKAYEKLENRCVQLEEANIKCYNSAQVKQSHRQIYCAHDDFDVAREVCRRWPRVCSPDRDRLRTN